MALGRKYNGFASYETWLTYTWITDNDTAHQALMNRLEHLIEKHRKSAVVVDRFATDIKDLITNFVYTINPTDAPDIDLKNDFVMSTISEVNWVELADKLIEGLDEYEF